MAHYLFRLVISPKLDCFLFEHLLKLEAVMYKQLYISFSLSSFFLSLFFVCVVIFVSILVFVEIYLTLLLFMVFKSNEKQIIYNLSFKLD